MLGPHVTTSATAYPIQGRSNVVADALSRNAVVGAVSDTPPVTTSSLNDLGAAQRNHDIWAKVIYTLEPGDETTLPRLLILFSQLFLSQDNILCRYWRQ